MAAPALEDLAEILIYKLHTQPAGFPGFGGIPNPTWWNHTNVCNGGYALGALVSNGNGFVPNHAVNFDGLRDDSVGSFIAGHPWWGHFPADPYVPGNPQVSPDWPATPYAVPLPATAPAVLPAANPAAYPREVPDLAPRVQPRPRPRTRPRFRARANIAIDVSLHRQPWVRFSKDVKPKRPDKKIKREGKSGMTGTAYRVMRRIADTAGEGVEWLDLLARASAFNRNSILIPEEWNRSEASAQLYWLFGPPQGINYIDWGEMFTLERANEVEDRIFGGLGNVSKEASQAFNLSTGFQTGAAF